MNLEVRSYNFRNYIFTLAVLLIAVNCIGQICSSSNTIVLNPIKDTWLDDGAKDNNYGTSTELKINREATKLQRALLQFDLSALSAGATIISASLKLTKTAGNSTINVDVHQISTVWDEGSGGSGGDPGDASWNERIPGISWSSPGGDYGASVSSVNILGNGNYYWDVASIVQDWVNGTANYGFLLESPDGGGNRTQSFSSREDPTPAMRPELTIDYVIGPILWLKADVGFSATTWIDQSGHGNDATVFGDPIQVANSLNFNSGINFDGDDHVEVSLPELAFDNGTKHVAIFAVYKPSTPSTAIGIYGNRGGASNDIAINNDLVETGAGSFSLAWPFGNAPHLLSQIIDEENNVGGGAGSSLVRLAGINVSSYNHDENNAAGVDPNFHIGKGGSSGSSLYFQGDIHEVIIYFEDNGSPAITDLERDQIESYLAIKYGIKLSHEYTDSQ